MSEREPPDPLARLGERIDKARARACSKTAGGRLDRSALQQGIGFGFRIGIELVVAIGVATALGWAIDHWLGTRPWGIIVLFFLGVAAGMLNVYRAVAGISTPVGYRRPGEDAAGKQAGQDRGTRTRTDVAIELRPLEQFTIERIVPIHIGGLDVSYTNAALMMTIAVVSVTALMVLAPASAALVPDRWQSVAEMLYEFVADMVDSNIGQGGRRVLSRSSLRSSLLFCLPICWE